MALALVTLTLPEQAHHFQSWVRKLLLRFLRLMQLLDISHDVYSLPKPDHIMIILVNNFIPIHDISDCLQITTDLSK